MKTRGLGKSLSFLHRMHNVIIRKVQLTLEKVDRDDESEFDAEIFDDDISINRTIIDQEQEDELRRYCFTFNCCVSRHVFSFRVCE